MKTYIVPLSILAAIVVGLIVMPSPKVQSPIQIDRLTTRVVEDVRSENERREALYRWSHDSLSRSIAALQDSIGTRSAVAGSVAAQSERRLIIAKLNQLESKLDLILVRQKRLLCWVSGNGDVLCK